MTTLDPDGGAIINDRRENHQKEKPPIPVSVKHITGEEEQNILAAMRKKAIKRKNNCEKYPKKCSY